NTTYAMPVMRPDTSIVNVDPMTHVATPGWQFATSDAMGNLTYNYQLDGIVGGYEARAYPADWQLGDGSGWNDPPLASVAFTDANPSANLDQCGNDSAPSPPTDGCSASASDWVNGNLGASKSFYREGDSIPYRLTFDNLSVDNPATPLVNEGAHTVT